MKWSFENIKVSENTLRDVADRLTEKKTKKKKHRILALIIIASSAATICATIFILCRFVLPKFAFCFEPDGDVNEEDEESVEAEVKEALRNDDGDYDKNEEDM